MPNTIPCFNYYVPKYIGQSAVQHSQPLSRCYPSTCIGGTCAKPQRCCIRDLAQFGRKKTLEKTVDIRRPSCYSHAAAFGAKLPLTIADQGAQTIIAFGWAHLCRVSTIVDRDHRLSGCDSVSKATVSSTTNFRIRCISTLDSTLRPGAIAKGRMSSTPTQKRFSTPTKAPATPGTESPGTWRHPRLAEITRRQNATTFSERNAKQVAYNVAAFASIIFVHALLTRYLPAT